MSDIGPKLWALAALAAIMFAHPKSERLGLVPHVVPYVLAATSWITRSYQRPDLETSWADGVVVFGLVAMLHLVAIWERSRD